MSNKKTPSLRFKQDDGSDFPDWEERRLGEVADIFMGSSPKSEHYNVIQKGEPLFQGNADIKNRRTAPRVWTTEITQRCFVNDILMSVRAPVGDIALAVHNGIIGRGMCAIRTSSYTFFYYALINAEHQWKKYSQGSTFESVNSRDIKEFQIGCPSLPEQQKIAPFLESVDTKIQLLERKVVLLQSYKKSVMQKLFSQELRFKDEQGNEYPDWQERSLKSILIDSRLGGNYSSSEKPNDTPLIKMGNLDRGKIILNKIEYINPTNAIDENDRIQYGDLFFNTRNTRDLVGKVAIWRDELSKAYYNSNLMWMKYDNNLFMNYRFNSYEVLKALRRIATGTTSVAAIYTKDLLKITVRLPSLPEQQKIASFLQSLDTKISLTQKQVVLTKQYKKGLLQRMFV